jgi:hypothetical protein
MAASSDDENDGRAVITHNMQLFAVTKVLVFDALPSLDCH